MAQTYNFLMNDELEIGHLNDNEISDVIDISVRL
jgi:hypothetical protein